MSLDQNDSLLHYGVKGMKWGVRRTDAQLSRSRGSDDFETATALRTKARTSGQHTLTNSELQTVINRMNLEQQYSRLATPTPATNKMVGDILKEVGKSTVKQLLNQAIQTGIKKAITK